MENMFLLFQNILQRIFLITSKINIIEIIFIYFEEIS